MAEMNGQRTSEKPMPRAVVPVAAISYPDELTFAIEAVEIFYEAGLLDDDCNTSTVLVSVFHEEAREEMRTKLKDKLTSADALRLIKFLDGNNWQVSLFVDGRD